LRRSSKIKRILVDGSPYSKNSYTMTKQTSSSSSLHLIIHEKSGGHKLAAKNE